MAILRKENVILRENNEAKIKELKAAGYEEVTEDDLKPKKATKAPSK
ncbi:hypothetical protein [Anoxybacillus sp. UARK-01]|nr:hypothetical protein [Anoxybacillus sp. UARK-01]